jgi:hypothetical protein
VLALLLCVAVGLSLTRLLGSGQPVLAWRTGLGAVGAVVATVSGVLSLARHRLSGDARLAYLGTALVGYGAVALPLGAVALQPGVDVVEIGAWRVGAAVAVLVLAARGLASPPVDSRLSVVRLAAGATAGGALISVALLAGTTVLDTDMLDLATRALELGWLLLAVGYVGTGLGQGRRVLFRAGCGLLLVAVALALQLIDPAPSSFPALSIATLRLVGVSFVLFALAQVVVNLLTNCARHAEGAAVTVRAECVADKVVVSVLDDGSAEGSARPGRGLGLVVSRRLAEEEGGRLQVVRGEQGGFGVSLELPAALRPVCSDLVLSVP